jgi:hypothetical protein
MNLRHFAFTISGLISFVASYTINGLPYMNDLECANCIRSGNNFCLWLYSEPGKSSITSWNCTQDYLTNGTAMGPGGVTEIYECSRGMDQLNAIIS